jgi:integrase/recombinase XerD
VLFGERICRIPDEWKAWSQNLGHESETTTFVGYGHVPSYRQAEIMRRLGEPGYAQQADKELAMMQASLDRLKASQIA